MQEEIDQRTVSITVQAAKLSGRVLKAAITAALHKMQQQRHSVKVGRNSLKRLAQGDGGMNTIEVSGRLRSFERYARKYQIRYHIEKEVGSKPPRWTVSQRLRRLPIKTLTAARDRRWWHSFANSRSLSKLLEKIASATRSTEVPNSEQKRSYQEIYHTKFSVPDFCLAVF